MARKPLHPLASEALMLGLRMAARAAVKAFDSVLQDAAGGLGAAERKVQTARRKLKKKVQSSGVRLERERWNEDDARDEEE